MKCRPGIIVCYTRGRPSKVRTSLRVSESCLFGAGPFQWTVLSCPFYDLFSISEAAGALIRVSLRELPHQYSSSSFLHNPPLTTVVCTSADTSALWPLSNLHKSLCSPQAPQSHSSRYPRHTLSPSLKARPPPSSII